MRGCTGSAFCSSSRTREPLAGWRGSKVAVLDPRVCAADFRREGHRIDGYLKQQSVTGLGEAGQASGLVRIRRRKGKRLPAAALSANTNSSGLLLLRACVIYTFEYIQFVAWGRYSCVLIAGLAFAFISSSVSASYIVSIWTRRNRGTMKDPTTFSGARTMVSRSTISNT